MPLEMFDGRLAARLPVSRGSYASITTSLVARLCVYHPDGLNINGYPAISPVLSTALSVVAPMIKRRRELNQTLDEAYDQIEARRARLDSVIPLEAALTEEMLDREKESLDNTREMVNEVMVCSSIIVGRELTLHLPKPLFEPYAKVSAGIVQTIEIHNAPAEEE